MQINSCYFFSLYILISFSGERIEKWGEVTILATGIFDIIRTKGGKIRKYQYQGPFSRFENCWYLWYLTHPTHDDISWAQRSRLAALLLLVVGLIFSEKKVQNQTLKDFYESSWIAIMENKIGSNSSICQVYLCIFYFALNWFKKYLHAPKYKYIELKRLFIMACFNDRFV